MEGYFEISYPGIDDTDEPVTFAYWKGGKYFFKSLCGFNEDKAVLRKFKRISAEEYMSAYEHYNAEMASYNMCAFAY